MLDGKLTLEAIVKRLMQRSANEFHTERDAMDTVSLFSERFSR